MAFHPRHRSRILYVAAPLIISLTFAGSASAEPGACRARIARESARFVQARMKAVAGCHEFVLKGVRTGPCPDALVLAAIAKAETKLRDRIAKSCGGANHTCGDGDDDALVSVGWDLGTCPNLHGGGCTNALANCDDVASCLACVAGAAGDEIVTAAYADLEPTPPQTELSSCQIRIVKETLRLVRSSSKALQRCWDGVNAGNYSGPCPLPGDGRAGPALVTAQERKDERICAICGGADGLCGGGDDLDVAMIGAPASCPAVTTPDGEECGFPIATVSDLVACIACVGAGAVSCVDAVAVPWGAGYPVECGG